MRLPILLSLLASTSAFAIPETRPEAALHLLENRDSFFSQGSFRSSDGSKVSYTRYGAGTLGPKGCLVISPGQGEASLKYVELAYDLLERGFAPIYAIDHRGQGFSDRPLPDREKNHVKFFSDYAKDFGLFLENIVLKNPACQAQRINLIAHSMGSAVAALYLESVGEHSPFKKAIFAAPMIKIHFPAGKSEKSVLWETWFACNTPFGPSCSAYVPGKGGYDPQTPFEGNPLTHSETRFNLKKFVYQKWPELRMGSPTVRWVRQSVLAGVRLRRTENAARIATPILILQASEDSIVDNSAQNEFCGTVRNCRVEIINGAKHEIFMEKDFIRDPALSLSVNFFHQP